MDDVGRQPRHEGAIVLYQNPTDFLHSSLVRYVEKERARRRQVREKRERDAEGDVAMRDDQGDVEEEGDGEDAMDIERIGV